MTVAEVTDQAIDRIRPFADALIRADREAAEARYAIGQIVAETLPETNGRGLAPLCAALAQGLPLKAATVEHCYRAYLMLNAALKRRPDLSLSELLSAIGITDIYRLDFFVLTDLLVRAVSPEKAKAVAVKAKKDPTVKAQIETATDDEIDEVVEVVVEKPAKRRSPKVVTAADICKEHDRARKAANAARTGDPQTYQEATGTLPAETRKGFTSSETSRAAIWELIANSCESLSVTLSGLPKKLEWRDDDERDAAKRLKAKVAELAHEAGLAAEIKVVKAVTK